MNLYKALNTDKQYSKCTGLKNFFLVLSITLYGPWLAMVLVDEKNGAQKGGGIRPRSHPRKGLARVAGLALSSDTQSCGFHCGSRIPGEGTVLVLPLRDGIRLFLPDSR